MLKWFCAGEGNRSDDRGKLSPDKREEKERKNMIEVLSELESGILLFIQDYIRNPVFNPFFITVTKLGNAGFIWVVLSVFLLIPRRTRRIGFMSILALLDSLLLNNLILKNLVERTRPYDIINQLEPLIQKQKDYSFPSGHTGSSFAAATVLYRNLPKKEGVWAMLLAVLIGVSRLYVGVHYLSDVLFGMMTGIGVGYLAEKLVVWWSFNQKKIRGGEI